jgi:hypothetical protein
LENKYPDNPDFVTICGKQKTFEPACAMLYLAAA